MKPLKRRILKRKLRLLWNDLGITKDEALDFLAAGLLIILILCMPILAEIIGALI